MLKNIIIIASIFVGSNVLANDLSYEHALVSNLIAKYQTLQTADITPSTPKVGDKCPQCNNPPGKCGVGKVGDGRICDTCLTCNGDGVIDEKDLNSSYETEEFFVDEEDNCITMYTGPGCVWCVKWEKEVMPKLLKAGWKVKKIDATSGPIPVFEMKLLGKDFNHTGYMDLNSFNSYVKKARE